VVRAETVARQQPVRQWTGWVAITWEPQQTRTQQQKSSRGYKSQRSSDGVSGEVDTQDIDCI
jgi:hypothetical protein